MPLERVWPALRWLARALETLPYLRDDELAQAGARLVYFLSLPRDARRLPLGGARDGARSGATASTGLWTRLPRLAVPAAFVWGERDQLVSLRFSRPVARIVPAGARSCCCRASDTG